MRMRHTSTGHGPLAQLAEQRTFNPRVVGSSPTGPTDMRGHSDREAFASAGNPAARPDAPAIQRAVLLGHPRIPERVIWHQVAVAIGRTKGPRNVPAGAPHRPARA